jgi:hypothetical protein
MRSREPLDEFKIGFGEGIREKIRRFDPSKLRNIDWVRLSIDDCAVEEMQLYGLRWIVMRRCVAFLLNLDVDGELFTQFALQRGAQRFTRFDLTSGEFPEAGKVRVGFSAGEKDVLVATDDSGCDGDHNT